MKDEVGWGLGVGSWGVGVGELGVGVGELGVGVGELGVGVGELGMGVGRLGVEISLWSRGFSRSIGRLQARVANNKKLNTIFIINLSFVICHLSLVICLTKCLYLYLHSLSVCLSFVISHLSVK